MPKLRVLAGPTPHDLTDITSLVNTNTSHRISTDEWEGEIVIFIKDFNADDNSTPEGAEYFGRSDRSGITWSIQTQGRFLSPRSSDDVLFGNIFERPLKLPWGTGAALKFMKYIDPTLSHDLTCTASQKPWALSPLVATMPYLRHTRLPSSCNHHPDSPCNSPSCGHSEAGVPHPPFPPPSSITDDTSSLHLAATPVLHPTRSGTPSSSGSSSSSSSRSSGSRWSSGSKKSKKKKAANDDEVPRTMNSQQRRSYFSSEDHRKAVSLGPQDVITTDFCYGFLEFAPSLRLKLPGGLGFDLARYWDGQGVRFVCCERRQVPSFDHASPIHEPECSDGAYEGEEHEGGTGEGEEPWGRVFWCVSIEMEEEAG